MNARDARKLIATDTHARKLFNEALAVMRDCGGKIGADAAKAIVVQAAEHWSMTRPTVEGGNDAGSH